MKYVPAYYFSEFQNMYYHKKILENVGNKLFEFMNVSFKNLKT